MQFKAKMTLLAAVLATCVWIALLIALVAWLEVIVIPESPAAAATLFAIAIAPGTVLGGWAVKMPRIARRTCPKCSWSKDYTIDGVR